MTMDPAPCAAACAGDSRGRPRLTVACRQAPFAQHGVGAPVAQAEGRLGVGLQRHVAQEQQVGFAQLKHGQPIT
jgi:hypothetical protein